ncbi:unnamed protein product [Phyllotreta striolata]|uniref:C2H2-type domain-containing protein n=1 Tax=Phyllotreta striolata TaxID=444603 RepID=A0A9N9XQS2_PHYSR|nr:unnamed protein product [Phyllotreta striolata]
MNSTYDPSPDNNNCNQKIKDEEIYTEHKNRNNEEALKEECNNSIISNSQIDCNDVRVKVEVKSELEDNYTNNEDKNNINFTDTIGMKLENDELNYDNNYRVNEIWLDDKSLISRMSDSDLLEEFHCETQLDESSQQLDISMDNEYQCNICQKPFNEEATFKMHLANHSEGKTHQCIVCQKSFKTSSKLNVHMLIHTGVKRFQCHVCKKAFTHKHVLKNHLFVHSGEKFQCNFCDKSFTRIWNLKNHLATEHTGEKKIQCNICQKSFTTNNNLKAHAVIHTGEKKFRCDICKKSFTRNNELKNHYSVHDPEKRHQCSFCGKAFTRKANLNSHLSGFHSQEGKLECDICSKTYASSASLKKHLIVHKGERNYHCVICQKSFARNNELKNHLLVHSSEKYQCDICPKSYRRSDDLLSHVAVHTGEAKYLCDICPKSFTRSYGLKRHLECHAGEKKHQCVICQKSYSTKGNLRAHLVSHTGEKKYQCQFCHKSYVRNYDLNTHLSVHTGVKRFQCIICQKHLTNRTSLKIHIATHTGEKNFQCNICQKSFIQRISLKKHILITHQGARNYHCDICQKSFTSSLSLKYHLALHKGEKNYHCNICQKAFIQPSALKTHQLIHTGKKKYQCNVCQKSFIQRSNLKNHMLTHCGEKKHQCNICQKTFKYKITLKRHSAIHTSEKYQVGKFDWKKSFIGKPKFAEIESKRVVVITEENVLACLNAKNGQILWRQILESPKEHDVKLLHLDKDIFTVSGGSNNHWIVRGWDLVSGSLTTEWPVTTPSSSEFLIINGRLVVVTPITGSHLEVTSYHLSSSQADNSLKILTPWLTDPSNCIFAKSYYVCISGNDYLGQLYYIDFLSDNDTVKSRSIQSVFDGVLGPVYLLGLNLCTSAFLLVSRNKNKLIEINDGNLEIKSYDVSTSSFIDKTEKETLYQLEASTNPGKLITVITKDVTTGQELSKIDLEYPIGLGAPTIISSLHKNSNAYLLLSTTDNALLLIKLPEGKVQWTREEALSDIVATEFFELPVSEMDASIENEFKTNSNNAFNMLMHRLTSQARQLSNFVFGSQLLSDSGLVRDEFGFHKLIVVATKVGKLFAIDTISGSIAWSYRLPNVRPFGVLDEEKMLLFVQRTARYAPLSAQCMLLAEDSVSGNSIVFQFDPITGYSKTGIEKLNYKILQAVLLPHEDENNLKPVVLISSNYDVFVNPQSAKSLVYEHIKQTHVFLSDSASGVLKGFNFHHSTEDNFQLTPTWEVKLNPSKVVSVNVKHPQERVHSQGRVLPDRSVYYKYVNPNLISVATVSEDPVSKHVLSVYLIDGVTGLVMYSVSHKRAKGPVHLVHSENWLVYSYFNERYRRTEVVSAELYEGRLQKNSTVFSSHAVSVLPHIQSQSYILPANPVTFAVTLTEKGITNKFVLIALSTGAVVEIPWLLLQPRFNEIPCGPEESCIPYMPEIPLPSEAVINYNQTLNRVRGIEVAPARLESTSHVLVHGLDMFYTRVAPSKTFDVLKEDFDHLMIVLVLTGLVVASYFTKYLASKKTMKMLWK